MYYTFHGTATTVNILCVPVTAVALVEVWESEIPKTAP